MEPRRRGRKNERGFALLLVFLMAAVVAIGLYMELPRYAMERQRDKEEVLIDRGEQYKRAIQLFVAKAKRYPGDIKELESFQNQRFLRHRYEDPLTGKDEWRLVHIQNGVLTDSKVVKPQGPGNKDEKKGPNGFVGELAGLGGIQNQTPGGGGANIKSRTRASDGNMPNMPSQGYPGQPMPGADVSTNQNGQVPMPGQSTVENGQLPGTTFTNPNQVNPNQQIPGMTVTGQPNFPGQTTNQQGQQMYPPNGFPGQQGMPQGIPGQANFGQRPGTTPAQTGNSFVGGGGSLVGGGSFVGGGTSLGSQPGTYQPLPGQPGAPVNSQIGGVSPYSTQPGANGVPVGFNQPGMQAQGNAAADMIRGILTTPRPGGMPQGNGFGDGSGLGGGGGNGLGGVGGNGVGGGGNGMGVGTGMGGFGTGIGGGVGPGIGGQTVGAQIAGVASTAEGEGVKVYNERTLYQEWEFIFDPQKQKRIPNPNVQGAGGTPADRMNQGGQPQNPQTPVPGR